MPDSGSEWPHELPRVVLVGAGVVGRSIAEAHLEHGVGFCLADQDAAALDSLCRHWHESGADATPCSPLLEGLNCIKVGRPDSVPADRSPLLIESIVESAEAKQSLFTAWQRRYGDAWALCSNTSTLRIDAVAAGAVPAPARVCGMHFFMPVHLRPAVEVVSGQQTDKDVIERVKQHAQRLGKQPLVCRDGPGFIVNRMLSPYLNQSLLLLCRGANEDQIRRAALAYGMPLSPLELIDWIGATTMYHAGRAFMNAFPGRLEPSPLVPALLKHKRYGRMTGRGLYDYHEGERSEQLAPQTQELVERYRTDTLDFSDGEVLKLLSIPMWIEATKLLEEGVADSLQTVDLAMAGGLGYVGDETWSDFFAALGEAAINEAVDRWSGSFRSMKP